MADNKSLSQFNQEIKLPLLIETIFTLSKLTVILTSIIVMVITFVNGNPYWVVMLRGGITVLILGLTVWFISWFVAKGVIFSARSMVKESQESKTGYSGRSMDTRA